MKKLAVALLFCGASAFATSVTYSTAAVLSGPDASGGDLKNATAVLTYTGQPSTTVGAPTGISLGFFTVSGAGTFAGDSIAITLTETAPSGGTGTTSSTIDGTISGNSNSITVDFAPTTFSIGTETYTLQQSKYFLVAPNTNGGVTSIQAAVTSVPEPASVGLLGASLLGLGMMFRRRKA